MVQPLSRQGIYVVLLRELKRYWRAKARIISSVAQSFFFLAVFGLGLGGFIGGVGRISYLSYLAPGIITVTLSGDVNGDRKVDLKDVFAVALAYGSFPGHPMWDPNLDIDGETKRWT